MKNMDRRFGVVANIVECYTNEDGSFIAASSLFLGAPGKDW